MNFYFAQNSIKRFFFLKKKQNFWTVFDMSFIQEKTENKWSYLSLRPIEEKI